MDNLITMYIIPSNVGYIQFKEQYNKFDKTNTIDPQIPTLIVFNESYYGHNRTEKEIILVHI
jgi:hypothetical protein